MARRRVAGKSCIVSDSSSLRYVFAGSGRPLCLAPLWQGLPAQILDCCKDYDGEDVFWHEEGTVLRQMDRESNKTTSELVMNVNNNESGTRVPQAIEMPKLSHSAFVEFTPARYQVLIF